MTRHLLSYLGFSQDPHRSLHRLLVLIGLCLAMTACGFTLRGIQQLPFTRIYTNLPENTEFGSSLQRALRASSPGLHFVNDPAQAEVQFIQISSNEWLRDQSLDASGRVEVYELNLEYTFQLLDNQGRVILEPTTLRSVRELPYDDSVVQAKQSEISTVFRNMRQSLIERIVHLMSSPNVLNAFKDPAEQPFQEAMPQTRPDPSQGGRPLWGAPIVTPGVSVGGP